ncbi:citrate synthase/methylcitrate synthase [Parageobacillus thermoglucosidasius]|uniref:Citrate synthase n=1 Tax=Parageobacillus thermoglucosidasius TaxID=1426 RepID=A0A1B7KR40_PARTM|nr:citrate synthase/methylcitrate synthase [Parageobacillus thermoglucosidasius]OAT72553.1 citrate synthase/methylcitrate synthase [Parageobacillus thermoglucosidasius]
MVSKLTNNNDLEILKTDISMVDGENGRLVYRGFLATELAKNYSFEEVAYLLWYGELPDKEKLAHFTEKLALQREIPLFIKRIIDIIPNEVNMMSVLRIALSALGESNYNWPFNLDMAISITAKIPTIIAYRYRQLQNKEPIEPDLSLSHTVNYLYMLKGSQPKDFEIKALETYLILTQEHGMNPSTFAGRIVASTRSDLISAVTAAISALKGPLHGGAPSKVTEMLEEIGTKENAETWLRNAIEKGDRLMGFGHRIYKTKDPRSVVLGQIVSEFSKDTPWFDLATYVEETAIRLLKEYKPNLKIYTNVEFYAAAVMKAINFEKLLYTPTFAVSRVVGWCAHFIDAMDKRLIYPSTIYTGRLPIS